MVEQTDNKLARCLVDYRPAAYLLIFYSIAMMASVGIISWVLSIIKPFIREFL